MCSFDAKRGVCVRISGENSVNRGQSSGAGPWDPPLSRSMKNIRGSWQGAATGGRDRTVIWTCWGGRDTSYGYLPAWRLANSERAGRQWDALWECLNRTIPHSRSFFFFSLLSQPRVSFPRDMFPEENIFGEGLTCAFLACTLEDVSSSPIVARRLLFPRRFTKLNQLYLVLNKLSCMYCSNIPWSNFRLIIQLMKLQLLK
jgi:hypothetical protein